MHHSIACSPRFASVATKIPPKTPNICLLEQKGNFVQKKKAIKKQTSTKLSPFLPVYSAWLMVNKERCRSQKEKLKLATFRCLLFVGGGMRMRISTLIQVRVAISTSIRLTTVHLKHTLRPTLTRVWHISNTISMFTTK